MYISYVDEIPRDYFLSTSNIKEYVYLKDNNETDNIEEYVREFGITEYKKLFTVIGIKYTFIDNSGLYYKIDTEQKLLHISSLSSGERMMLYAMIMSKLNKPFMIIGLSDRLDKKHRNILLNHPEYFATTVILVFDNTQMNDDLFGRFYKPFTDILKEEIYL